MLNFVVLFCLQESDAFTVFKQFKSQAEKESGLLVKCLRTYCGDQQRTKLDNKSLTCVLFGLKTWCSKKIRNGTRIQVMLEWEEEASEMPDQDSNEAGENADNENVTFADAI
ncbi:hypothetical protein V2J09_006631 [Rumex salicifolius]